MVRVIAAGLEPWGGSLLVRTTGAVVGEQR